MRQLNDDDSALIETVLRGYPPSTARDDALSTLRRATPCVPHADAWIEANLTKLVRQDSIWTAEAGVDRTQVAAGHGYTAQEALNNLQLLLEGPQASTQQQRDALLREIGRQMVNITTTVSGDDEWLTIPELWLECMRERDEAQNEVVRLRGLLPPQPPVFPAP